MATSPDHPELQFVQASGYTKGRADGPPLWIVIHDMEANETANTAEATANYFATGAGGRSVSSHYTADNDSVVQCVLLRDTAWTVGNRPGNYRGINWELAGFAAQTRAQWLDPFGIAMFNRIAPIIRSDAARFHIPLVRRTVAELRAFTPGVTSHNDLGVAFGGTDHTDPGPNFPWDYLMALLAGAGPTAPTEGGDPMFAMKEQSNTAVWLTNGINRRAGITWAAITAMYNSGLIQKPTGGTDGSGFVYVVPDGQIEMYAGPEAHGPASAELSPEEIALVAAAAKAGAEAGAPTHEELVAAANEAEDS